jgi:dUTP pyrophosphatase
MAQYKLLINPVNTSVAEFYINHNTYNEGDSGLDLFVPEDITLACGETKFIDLQIKCEMINTFLDNKNSSYYLYARSSISKTPLILKNSVGIIDAGYRGNLIAAVYYSPTFNDFQKVSINQLPNSYTIKKGTRLVQICAPELQPFSFEVVNTLTETDRGEGGFGSTGK